METLKLKKVIESLSDIDLIIQYLQENWQKEYLVVNVWEFFIRKADRYIKNEGEIEKLKHFLLDNWDKKKITIFIVKRKTFVYV